MQGVSAVLKNLSDEQLWTVINQRLPSDEDQRLSLLIEKGKAVDLSAQETAELEALIKKENQQMVIRSKALVLLKQRGHDIDSYLAEEK